MNRKLEWKRIREVLLVVVIPAIIILVSLYKGGIYPFGDKTLIYHDMQYQYIDFFMWFHDVLHGKAAIGYSFAAGLGSNTIALVAYYLSSPLNLLVYFVQQENMAGFLTFLICLKMLLCSVTVYIYVKKRFNLSSIYVILLGISYSFTGYNVLQCSNIMWLDGVIILPLIALGIYKMLWEGKKKIYFWALFYAVFSNWYIGYMLCLFSVLYFIFESIVYYWECGTKLKEFIRNIINFALTSILSVLATSFLFLPQTIFMMQEGKPFDWTIFQPEYGFSFLQGFRDVFLEPDKLTITRTNPPIYTGSFVLVLVMLLFVSKQVSEKKKYLCGLFLSGIMFVFQFKPLDCIFTGFRSSPSHMYRYAFMFSFFMIVTAAWGMRETQKIEAKIVKQAVIVILLLGIFLDYVQPYALRDKLYISLWNVILIGICLIAISTKKKKWIVSANIILICCMSGEFVEKLQMEFADHTQSAWAYEEYNKKIKDSVVEIQKEDTDAYRMDKTFTRTVWCGSNESLAFGYSSVAQYSSAGNVEVGESLRPLGYTYDTTLIPYETILPSDSLLGVKYIYSKTPVFGCEVVKKNIIEDVNMYRNPYALPIGYEIKEETENMEYGWNALENHNILFGKILGEEVNIYADTEILSTNTDHRTWTEWDVKIKKAGQLYGYFSNVQPYMQVYVNGNHLKYMEWYDNCILGFGNYSVGDTVKIRVAANGQPIAEDYGLCVGTLDMEKFENSIQKIRLNSCNVLKMENGFLKAEYENAKDSNVMFTVPYEKGWEVKVNGKKTDYTRAANSFIGIQVPAGKNVIEMEYKVPGARAGVVLSIIAIVAFYSLEQIQKVRKGRKR